MKIIELLRREHSRTVEAQQVERTLSDEILERGPESRSEWGLYVEEIIGPPLKGLVDVRGTPMPGNDSPVDAAWEVYCLLCGRDRKWRVLSAEELSKRVKRIGILAARGAGKTMWMVVIAFTVCNYHDGYGVSWTARQSQQIDQAWRYFRLLAAPQSPFASRFAGPANRKIVSREVNFINGSVIWRVEPTIDGLNSKHPNSFFLDEVERMEWKVIVEGLFSAMTSVGSRYPIVYVMGSTQKQQKAIMYKIRNEAKEGRFKLYRFNGMAVVEPCPSWRRKSLEGVSCTDYDELIMRQLELKNIPGRSQMQNKELLQVSDMLARLTNNCNLVRYCRGLAINGRGYYTIEKLLMDLQSDEKIFRAQIMNEQPSMENAMYEEFGEDNLKRVYWNSGAETIGAIDYGNVLDPTAIGLMNQVGSSLEMFMEEELRNADEDAAMVTILRLHSTYGVTRWSVDPSAYRLKRLMREAGIEFWAFKRERVIGYSNVARFICSGENQRRLFINPDLCPRTVEQLGTYERLPSGEPRTARIEGPEGHHWDFCDMIRYACNMCSVEERESRMLRRSWYRR